MFGFHASHSLNLRRRKDVMRHAIKYLTAVVIAIAVAEADPELSVALTWKVYPMRSHTVAAAVVLLGV